MNVYEVDIRGVRFSEGSIILDLADGRTVSAPLSYYPTLLFATEKQRRTVEVVGHIAHWPLLDTDLSSDCLLQGAKELPVYALRSRRRTGPQKRETMAVAETRTEYRPTSRRKAKSE